MSVTQVSATVRFLLGRHEEEMHLPNSLKQLVLAYLLPPTVSGYIVCIDSIISDTRAWSIGIIDFWYYSYK